MVYVLALGTLLGMAGCSSNLGVPPHSCSFQLKGSTASVTITGSDAQAACAFYVTTGAIDPLDQDQESTVVCEYQIGANAYKVEDAASYKFAGDLLCSELQQQKVGSSGYPDL